MFLRGSHSLSATDGRESWEDSYPNFEIENEASDLKQDRRKMAKNGKREKESVKNEEDTSELIGKNDKSITNEPAEPDQSSVPGKDTSNHDSEDVSALVEETLVPTTAITSETTTETTTATTTATTSSEEASNDVAANELELDEDSSVGTTLPTSLEKSYNNDSEDVSALVEETLVPTTSSTSLSSEIEWQQDTMVPSSGSNNFNNAFGQGDDAQDFDKYATAENENITDDDNDWLLDDGNDFGGPLFLAFILVIGGLLFFWRKRSNPNGVQGEYHPVPTMAGRSKLHSR